MSRYGAVVRAEQGEVQIVGVLGGMLWQLRPAHPPTVQDRYELMGAAGTYGVSYGDLLAAAGMTKEPSIIDLFG